MAPGAGVAEKVRVPVATLQIRTRLDTEVRNGMTASVARDDGAMATADERPIDTTPVHTVDLPPTPQRDRNIPATAWVEAPAELLALGDDIDQPLVAYKRRIGRWLLWRAGPAVKADARYMAIDADDLTRQCTFRLFPDGHGEGHGPDGATLRAIPHVEGSAARLDVSARATAGDRPCRCAARRCRRRSSTRHS